MNHSLRVGFSFGLTSAIITTVGLMVGLYSSTNSQLAVIGGVLTIAIADAFSDSLGIHVSEESEGRHTTREVWESTASTFLSKFLFAMTFIVPLVLIPEFTGAILVSVLWGLFLLSAFSLGIARRQGKGAIGVVGEHLIIALAVILITYHAGAWIHAVFMQ